MEVLNIRRVLDTHARGLLCKQFSSKQVPRNVEH